MIQLYKLFQTSGFIQPNYIFSKTKKDPFDRTNVHYESVIELCSAIQTNINSCKEIKVRQVEMIDSDIKLKLKFRFVDGFVVYPKLKGFEYTATDGSFIYPTFEQFLNYEEPPEINPQDKPIVQHLMDLSRTFRSTPADLYDRTYQHLQDEIYRALDSKAKGITFKPKELTFD